MSLIGILTEASHENYLKEELKKICNKNQVFFLKENSISNLKNIQFEVLLIGKKVDKSREEIRKIASKANYVIFNLDILENAELLKDLELTLINYGFNSKATITASSTEEEKNEGKMLICLQRSIKNKKQEKIEQQELQTASPQGIDAYCIMEKVALELVLSKKN